MLWKTEARKKQEKREKETEAVKVRTAQMATENDTKRVEVAAISKPNPASHPHPP